MKPGKLLLIMTLALALLIPQLVLAGQAPVRVVQPDQVQGTVDNAGDGVSGGSYQDTGGRLRWFGNMFLWQFQAWARYMSRWPGYWANVV